VVLLAAVEVAVLNDQSLALDAVKLRVAPHQHEASANGTDANADRDLDGRVCAHPATKLLSQELLRLVLERHLHDASRGRVHGQIAGCERHARLLAAVSSEAPRRSLDGQRPKESDVVPDELNLLLDSCDGDASDSPSAQR
jgi:hypothetical protein